MESDAHLLTRWTRHRDSTAFAALAERHAGLVYGTCRRITGDHHAAEDLAQDVLLEFAQKARQVRQSVAGFLHSSARSRALNHCRDEAVRQRHEEAAGQRMPLTTPEPSTWRDLEHLLDAALAGLDTDQRAVILLHFLEGRSQVEVAEALGINQATVSRRLSRGLEALRTRLAGVGLVLTVVGLSDLFAAHAAEAAPSAVLAAVPRIGTVTGGQVLTSGMTAGTWWTALGFCGIAACVGVLILAIRFRDNSASTEPISPNAPGDAMPRPVNDPKSTTTNPPVLPTEERERQAEETARQLIGIFDTRSRNQREVLKDIIHDQVTLFSSNGGKEDRPVHGKADFIRLLMMGADPSNHGGTVFREELVDPVVRIVGDAAIVFGKVDLVEGKEENRLPLGHMTLGMIRTDRGYQIIHETMILYPPGAPATTRPSPDLADSTLHLAPGDHVADLLRSLPGTVQVWRDPVAYGPVAAGDRYYQEHAATIAEFFGNDSERAARSLREADAALLAAVSARDETVLWFDACLYDTLQLVRVLDLVGAAGLDPARLSLVWSGSAPDGRPIHGLGQLTAGDLAILALRRRLVTPAQVALARRVWVAYTDADPRGLVAVWRSDTSALPHLAAALRRHLERFPATTDGLSVLEREALRAVSEGKTGFAPMFCAVSDRHAPAWFGDTYLVDVVRDLARAPDPLLELGAEPRDPQQWHLALTDAGRAVLAGRRNALQGRILDRWIGAVHLQGPNPAWQWDPATETLVETP